MNAYHQNQPITQWADADRPREKFRDWGSRSTSMAELLAIIIRSGGPNESALDLSRRILNFAKYDLHQLGKMSVEELQKFKGIGEAKAITILAALDLGRRTEEQKPKPAIIITSSFQVFQLFEQSLSSLNHEEFWVVMLNRGNKVLKKHRISTGGISGTVADIRIIFKTALKCYTTSIILVHNHPSGNTKPSNSDLKLTQRIKESGQLLDITVLDHLIIGENGYFSFADEELL